MKKLIMAVLLVIYSNLNAQTLTDSTVRKRQFTIDIKDPLIRMAGSNPGNELLKVTYKQEINDKLRWTLSGSALFPYSMQNGFQDNTNKGNVRYLNDIRNAPEIQLNGGLEFTKTKGKFTRYLGTELYIKYGYKRKDVFSSVLVFDPASPSGYKPTGLLRESKQTQNNIGAGISLFYGYEYKLSKHWAINAEVRYDSGVMISDCKSQLGDVNIRQRKTTFNGSMDGLISNIGINYLFYHKKK